MIEQPWTDDPAEVLNRRVLAHIVHNVAEQGLGAVAEAVGHEQPEVGQAFGSLARRGLVAVPSQTRMAVTYPSRATPTSEGRASVSRWRSSTPRDRRRACAAAVLSWLDSRDGERIRSTEEFRSDPRAYYYAEPFDDEVLLYTVRDLIDRRLMSGTGTFQGPVLRPQITPLGEIVVARYGGDLSQWEAERHSPRGGGAPINIVTHSQGVNIANNSPGTVQTAVVVEARDTARQLADTLAALLPHLGLGEEQATEAAKLADELRTLAPEIDKDRNRGARLAEKVSEIAVQGTGSAVGVGIVALAHQLGDLLSRLPL